MLTSPNGRALHTHSRCTKSYPLGLKLKIPQFKVLDYNASILSYNNQNVKYIGLK